MHACNIRMVVVYYPAFLHPDLVLKSCLGPYKKVYCSICRKKNLTSAAPVKSRFSFNTQPGNNVLLQTFFFHQPNCASDYFSRVVLQRNCTNNKIDHCASWTHTNIFDNYIYLKITLSVFPTLTWRGKERLLLPPLGLSCLESVALPSTVQSDAPEATPFYRPPYVRNICENSKQWGELFFISYLRWILRLGTALVRYCRVVGDRLTRHNVNSSKHTNQFLVCDVSLRNTGPNVPPESATGGVEPFKPNSRAPWLYLVPYLRQSANNCSILIWT